jgi:hypothetical protein
MSLNLFLAGTAFEFVKCCLFLRQSPPALSLATIANKGKQLKHMR